MTQTISLGKFMFLSNILGDYFVTVLSTYKNALRILKTKGNEETVRHNEQNLLAGDFLLSGLKRCSSPTELIATV